jgi:shikimate dehydrogenase
MGEPPDRYALFGNPIAHSPSPQIHAAFARQTQQALVYEKREVAVKAFSAEVRGFFDEGGKGLNITLPFKHAAFEFADWITPRARRAKAVNVLWREPGGAIVGDNTDGAGFIRDVVHNLGLRVTGRRVLFLGAGGAARGVLAPLLEQEPARVHVINRTAKRAQTLAREFTRYIQPNRITGGGFDRLPRKSFDLIVNATAAGHTGDVPPLPPGVFARGTLCYDLNYGEAARPFLARAEEFGGHAIDGWGMLIEQAAESFFLWRRVHPDTAPILADRNAYLDPSDSAGELGTAAAQAR